MALKTARFQMMLSPAEITAVDDMRFRERVPSRAEAIRQLIDRGLRVSNPGARNDDADEGQACRHTLVGVGNPATGGPSAHER